MDFLTAQQECAALLGLDIAETNTATLIKRWLNFAYKDMAGYYPWAWLESREQVVTEADYTTGTVSATSASTTITFSGAITASRTGYFIQFSSADDWYKISAHTAGSDTATLETAYVQSSNLTAGTFTIRKFYYSLSSSCERIIDVMQAVSPRKLRMINVLHYDQFRPFTTSTGDTQAIITYGQDSTGNWTFIPYPFPDSAIILEFKTIKKITELSANTDTPIFPARFDSIWIEGALARGYRFNDDDRYTNSQKLFYSLLDNAKGNDTVAMDEEMVIQACDQRIPMRGLSLPENYDISGR
jgi:hypothetical protein